MRQVLVIGGYGTFGTHVSRELVRRHIPITIAGRDLTRAKRLARELGDLANATAVDVTSATQCQAAFHDHGVVVQCAGPFVDFDDTLLQAGLGAGVHYVDLADDRGYVQRVRRLGQEFARRQLTAAFGCSSLPAISGAAALRARGFARSAVEHARVTLFIGNNNPKGQGAVESAARRLGAWIDGPHQARRRAFGDRELVPLPPPFGPRGARNFDSPDYDLLPELLATPSIVVKVSFEWELTNLLFAAFSRLAPRLGRWLLPRLASVGGGLAWLGSSGGVVMVELFLADGGKCHCAVVALTAGQRMAALPAVYVAERLARGEDCPRGAVAAYEALGGERLLELLTADGYQVICRG